MLLQLPAIYGIQDQIGKVTFLFGLPKKKKKSTRSDRICTGVNQHREVETSYAPTPEVIITSNYCLKQKNNISPKFDPGWWQISIYSVSVCLDRHNISSHYKVGTLDNQLIRGGGWRLSVISPRSLPSKVFSDTAHPYKVLNPKRLMGCNDEI